MEGYTYPHGSRLLENWVSILSCRPFPSGYLLIQRRPGLYISTLPDMSIEDNFMATIQGLPIPPHTVSLCAHDKHVLEIDVEAAWAEMALKPGYSNEAEVNLYFGLD
jgi:hypothetical protein